MSGDWSRDEVEVTVDDYLAMLLQELHCGPVNKAKHNRFLQQLLPERSRGAIEFKHANISAVLIELGYPYVDGYKPRSNYQEVIREVILQRISADASLRSEIQRAVDRAAEGATHLGPLTEVFVPVPVRSIGRDAIRERVRSVTQIKPPINYLEREARNSSLGLAGELFVLQVEHARLSHIGMRRLADRIEHVSKTTGDGLGYDILSYETDGRERFIEVKTTRYGQMTPFFTSRNEVEVSVTQAAQYHLYRVFKFQDRRPKIFILSGSIRQSCNLDPIHYEATVS